MERVRDRLGWLGTIRTRAATASFLERLREEARRSERYDRTFSLLVLGLDEPEAQDLYDRVKPYLRAADIVQVIEPREKRLKSRCAEETRGDTTNAGTLMKCELAAILPETDKPGAETAARRLRSMLPDIEGLRLGVAVYRHDATETEDLLAVAENVAA